MNSATSGDDSQSGEPSPAEWENPTKGEIAQLLRATKRIAVVGLSSNPSRPSNGVSSYLLRNGYEIVPINPNEVEVLGVKAYATLGEAPGSFDVVQIFRRSEHVPQIVNEAIKIGAKAIWMQEGVISNTGYARARKAGLTVIMDRCMLKDHGRLSH